MVGMVVALVGEREPRPGAGARLDEFAPDVALDLHAEGEALLAREEPGELQVLDVAGTQTDFDAGGLLLGQAHGGVLLDLLQGKSQRLHNTAN